MHYYLYGGHGLCMAWYGVTDLDRGLMTLVETPDDAAVDVPRHEGRLHLAPQWNHTCVTGFDSVIILFLSSLVGVPAVGFIIVLIVRSSLCPRPLPAAHWLTSSTLRNLA